VIGDHRAVTNLIDDGNTVGTSQSPHNFCNGLPPPLTRLLVNRAVNQVRREGPPCHRHGYLRGGVPNRRGKDIASQNQIAPNPDFAPSALPNPGRPLSTSRPTPGNGQGEIPRQALNAGADLNLFPASVILTIYRERYHVL